MKRKSIITTVIVFVILVILAPGGMTAGSGTGSETGRVSENRITRVFHLETSGSMEGTVTIVFPKGEENLALELEETVEGTAAKLEGTYGMGLPPHIVVEIFGSEESFRMRAPGSFPEWGAGAALSGSSTILLKSPSIHYFRFPIRNILAHELGHLALFRLGIGGGVPLWFHEGFATHVGGEHHFSDHLHLFKAASSGSLIPLESLNRFYPDNPQRVTLAYVESYDAFDFLLQKKGVGGLRELLSLLREGNDWEDSFMGTYGIGSRSFSREWIARTRNRYGWIILLSDRSMLWVGLTALVLLAGVVKIWKTQRKKKKWENGERNVL